LVINDSSDNEIVSLTPSMLNVTHPRVNLSLNSSYVDSTVTPHVNYASLLELQDKGFRFSRQATNATTGALTGAWQLRMASGDSYFYGGQDIEIKAGALSLDSESQVTDLGKGDIHLYAGGKLEGSSLSEMNFNSFMLNSTASSVSGTTTTVTQVTHNSRLSFIKKSLTLSNTLTTKATATNTATSPSTVTVTTTNNVINSLVFSLTSAALTSPNLSILTDTFQLSGRTSATWLNFSASGQYVYATNLTFAACPAVTANVASVYVLGTDGKLKSITLAALKTLLA